MKDIIVVFLVIAILAFLVATFYIRVSLSAQERKELEKHRAFADRIRELASQESQVNPESLLAFNLLDESRLLDRSITSKNK